MLLLRYLTLFLVIFSFQSLIWGQLNCLTIKNDYGDSTVCYHQNGKVSTISYNDRANDLYQQFLAVDLNGNKMFEGGQGYRHGGVSLEIKYFSNGSISSVRSTFQPDGGIQYYDATTYFNEDGTFHHKEDNSWDRTWIQEPTFQPVIQSMKLPAIKIDTFSVQLINLSSFTQKILVIDLKNREKNRIVKIKKNHKIEVGVYQSEKSTSEVYDFYNFEIIPTKKKASVRIQKLEIISNGQEKLFVISPYVGSIPTK